MVCTSASELAGKLIEPAGMRCKTSRRLHDIAPSSMKWRKQKHLRCADENANGGRDPGIAAAQSRLEESAECRNVANAMEAVREKIMLDLKTVADKLKQNILRKEERESDELEVEEPLATAEVEEKTALPWKLRPRTVGREKKSAGEPRPEMKPAKKPAALKLVVPLSKKEIEEDFLKMLGRKPPKRLKRRTRIVQTELDARFPGLCLAKISADSYDIPE